MRVVDLCGNSIELEQADEQIKTKPFPFLRFEPISAPVIVLQDELKAVEKPGESLDHIIIRTANVEQKLDSVPNTDKVFRHIVPPQTSQILAEMHGMFDNITGTMKSDRLSYGEIYKRHSKVENPEQGNFEKWNDIISNNPTASPKCYPIYRKEQAIIPYLPDPASAGATLRNLPGTGLDAVTIGEIDDQGILRYTNKPLPSLPSTLEPIISLTKVGYGSIENSGQIFCHSV